MSIRTPLVVGDIIRVVFYTTANGQAGLNVNHLQILTVIPPASLEELGDDLSLWGNGIYPDVMSEEAVYQGCDVMKYGVPDSYIYFKANPSLGANIFGLTTTQSSPVITKQTGFAGRKNRGRLYVPFIPQNFISTEGGLSIEGIGKIITFADHYAGKNSFKVGETPLGTFTWTLPYNRVIEPMPVGDFVASGKIGTQRRRGQYGKKNT
jgi:hypothetical protein